MDSFEAVVTPFLKKLLILVNDTPKEVGEWDSEGKVYIVKMSSKFEESLRRYFKGTLQTFIRQLHFYGFSKMDIPRNNSNSWSFSHPFFLRDDPALITNIKRKVSSQQNAQNGDSSTTNNNRKKSNNNNNDNISSAQIIYQKDQEIEELRRQVTSLTETVNELANFVGFKKNRNISSFTPVSTYPSTSFPQFVAQNVPTIEKLTKKRMAPEPTPLSQFQFPYQLQGSLLNVETIRNEPCEKRQKNESENAFPGFLEFSEFSGLPLMDLSKCISSRKKSDDENTVASVSTEDLMGDFVREFESPGSSSDYSLSKFSKSENMKISSDTKKSSIHRLDQVTV